MNSHSPRHASKRSGVILLVVLGALMFFSLIVASYVVFSKESHNTSFALSQRSTRVPDINWVMNESLMTLIRGTSDPNNPFYGEDLLSDYYGHDSTTLQAKFFPNDTRLIPLGPRSLDSGFVRFAVASSGSNGINRPAGVAALNDVYTGGLITFTEGPLRNQTYRVLRSVYVPPIPQDTTTSPVTPAITAYDNLYIDLKHEVFGNTAPNQTQIRSLFYSNPANFSSGYTIHLNGAPLNSRGVGFNGTNLDATTGTVTTLQQPRNPNQPLSAANPNGGDPFPVALQPNHLGRIVDKSTTPGDFDEDYDAADHNNWFLSHRRPDGSVIPSFHRPAVLNYILNETADWSTAGAQDYQDLMANFARATFRPLPIGPNQLGANVPGVNERFTGGSNEFALRTALPILGQPGMLDQFAAALISGDWDVDNDADGIPDSVWIDLGLPTFTSREGKLIRPLVAPMIEDLSGRLNLNAHGNPQLNVAVAGMTSNGALWAGNTGAAGASATVFRGLGWGPSEIMLPSVSSSGLITNATVRNNLAAIINDRYRHGEQQLANPDVPGITARDPLDVLRFGYRRPAHFAAGGFGYSTDPFGRGGLAMGRSGHIYAARSGTLISADDPMTTVTEPTINEAINTPYESDPSGVLSGDRAFTIADLESVLRSHDFDSELLPDQLRERLRLLLDTFNEHSASLTTTSVSADAPPAASSAGGTPFLSLVSLINQIAPGGANYTQAQWNQLIAPEIRMGRKLDVNRAIGNRVDDNSNRVIDEPLEVNRADSDGVDNDGDMQIDELGEFVVGGETLAYRSLVGNVPNDFNMILPHYVFEEPPAAAGEIPVNGRQMLARHLYILAMALSRDLQAPATEASFPSLASPPPGSFDPALYKARRLAQWAVNVVDYSDPDSIMTRFVFDATPFDATGWSPPADLYAGPAPDYNVVWGVEEPQLVFSESSAFHDVRVRDTNRDGSENATKTDPTPDNDTDQVRIPEGSLFLELYCPHPVVNGDQTTKPSYPQELYTTPDTTTGVSELDLARLAPPIGASDAGGAPVWRIAISERHDSSVAANALAPATLRSTVPDSASFEPENPDSLVSPTPTPLLYDRFIWFRDFPRADTNPDFAFTVIDNLITANNISDMTAAQVFFAPSLTVNNAINSDRFLEPGQFLTLAPRINTRFGSKEHVAGTYPGVPSNHRRSINLTQGLIQTRHDDTRITPPLAAAGTAFTPALPMLIAAPRPSGWVPSAPANSPESMIGLNVSEPLPRGGSYYQQPLLQLNGTQDVDGDGNEDYPFADAYIDFSDPATSALDTPLDVGLGRVPVIGAAPNTEPALGTFENYCSAFLQRLADPTMPYDAVTNPYRTVDWITIDLTVFSGEERETDVSGAGSYTRTSRQRNGNVSGDGGVTSTPANALYSYETNNINPADALDSGSLEFFEFMDSNGSTHLHSSYSFLNTTTTGFAAPYAQMNPGFSGFAPSIGSLGNQANAVTGNDRNLPQIPYAVHPWLNRPFATHYELMLVPASSQARLFEEFSFDPAADPAVYPDAATPADAAVFNAPFRHLLNFFHSSETSGGSLEMAKIFDFVHTLPRFRGEVDLINPQRLTSNNPLIEPELATMRTLLLPPFAIKYDNMRQGRINLNTMSQFPVWAGLMQGHLNTAEFTTRAGSAGGGGSADQLSFDNFLLARRGYTVSSTAVPTTIAGNAPFNYDPANLDASFPTEFAGVFQSAINAPFAMPLRNATDSDLLRRRAVNGTLLRAEGTLAATENAIGGLPNTTSLFVRDALQLPVVSPTNNQMHDRFRNPFMKYQTLMRMPNLVSNNSQVFLIRLTVGFFEVDAQTQTLQNEYNADLGRNQRYQAAFVVDRSIPVGFIPGEDLNTRDIVVFESYAQ